MLCFSISLTPNILAHDVPELVSERLEFDHSKQDIQRMAPYGRPDGR